MTRICWGASPILIIIFLKRHYRWWLCERQLPCGGLNGRPEKRVCCRTIFCCSQPLAQEDVCYSWWVLSALSILGKVVQECLISIALTKNYQIPWISREKLATFIFRCQDSKEGGISDRPENMPDVFHTFFGVSEYTFKLTYLDILSGCGSIFAGISDFKVSPQNFFLFSLLAMTLSGRLTQFLPYRCM